MSTTFKQQTDIIARKRKVILNNTSMAKYTFIQI